MQVFKRLLLIAFLSAVSGSAGASSAPFEISATPINAMVADAGGASFYAGYVRYSWFETGIQILEGELQLPVGMRLVLNESGWIRPHLGLGVFLIPRQDLFVTSGVQIKLFKGWGMEFLARIDAQTTFNTRGSGMTIIPILLSVGF